MKESEHIRCMALMAAITILFGAIASALADDSGFRIRISSSSCRVRSNVSYGHHRHHRVHHRSHRDYRYHTRSYCDPEPTYCYPRSTAYVIYGRDNPRVSRSYTVEPIRSTSSRVIYGDIDAAKYVVDDDVRLIRTPKQEQTTSGWDALAIGSYADALRYFGAQAQARPGDSVPKIGYALASAGVGRLNQAIWAMRRALRSDPDGVRDARVHDRLKSTVREWIGQYEYGSQNLASEADVAFMVAALRYLIADTTEAALAIEAAPATDDEKPSTTNLKRLINEAVDAKHIESTNRSDESS